MELLKTSGTIIYDPARGTMKSKTDWWVIIQLDRGITDYYRWWLDRYWWECDHQSVKRRYCEPSWGSHVSIGRGEVPKHQEKWKRLHGKRVNVEYSPLIRQTSESADGKDYFWFLDAHCPEFVEIRRELGLQWQRDGIPFRGHITIARSY